MQTSSSQEVPEVNLIEQSRDRSDASPRNVQGPSDAIANNVKKMSTSLPAVVARHPSSTEVEASKAKADPKKQRHRNVSELETQEFDTNRLPSVSKAAPRDAWSETVSTTAAPGTDLVDSESTFEITRKDSKVKSNVQVEDKVAVAVDNEEEFEFTGSRKSRRRKKKPPKNPKTTAAVDVELNEGSINDLPADEVSQEEEEVSSVAPRNPIQNDNNDTGAMPSLLVANKNAFGASMPGLSSCFFFPLFIFQYAHTHTASCYFHCILHNDHMTHPPTYGQLVIH